MTYTAAQVEAAIEGLHEERWGSAWDYNEEWQGENRLLLDIDGVQEYAEYVDGKPAEEGGGETIFAIFKVGDQYFRKDGYYLSHDGSYWDGDLFEVHPTQKTVTVYEAV